VAGEPRSEVAIDLRAVRSNVLRLLRPLRGGQLWAVVKADGYGHGASEVGRAALEAGATGLAVATLGEAHTLRPAAPEARIMVMSPLVPGEEAAAGGFEIVVSTPDGRDRALAAGPLAVHVKVETGMGRWGLTPEAALDLGRRLAGDPSGPRLAGLMTHLATSEEPDTASPSASSRASARLPTRFPPAPATWPTRAGSCA
jgi:alanine racemase